jgi:hypothetical protein
MLSAHPAAQLLTGSRQHTLSTCLVVWLSFLRLQKQDFHTFEDLLVDVTPWSPLYRKVRRHLNTCAMQTCRPWPWGFCQPLPLNVSSLSVF